MIRRVAAPDENRYPLSHFLFTTGEAKKIGPSTIAAAIGKSVPFVCEVERGTRKANEETLALWAKRLGVAATKLRALANLQEIAAAEERVRQLKRRTA